MRGIIPHSIVDNVPQRPYAVQRALRMSPRSGQFSPVYPGLPFQNWEAATSFNLLERIQTSDVFSYGGNSPQTLGLAGPAVVC
jgi:hypothetical protein